MATNCTWQNALEPYTAELYVENKRKIRGKFGLVGSIYADDKSPKQILGGKPAETSNESSRYYDVHGRFAGRSSARGST